MKWLLVFLSTSYSGHMSHIELSSKQECERVRSVLIEKQLNRNNRVWAELYLSCIQVKK